MFTIQLQLAAYPISTGCEALDFQRYWKLPETATVKKTYSNWKFARVFPVAESFARLHFAPDSLRELQDIPLDLLLPGEVIADKTADAPGDLVLSPDISPERAEHLFVTARMARLRQQVEELKTEVERLKNAIEGEPAEDE